MPLEQHEAAGVLVVQQRLDQLEALHRIGQELHLQQALGVFLRPLAVEDDARADAHLAVGVAEDDGVRMATLNSARPSGEM